MAWTQVTDFVFRVIEITINMGAYDHDRPVRIHRADSLDAFQLARLGDVLDALTQWFRRPGGPD